MTTTTFYCTSNSANIRSDSATYSTASTGGGSVTLDTPIAVLGQRISGGTYRCYEGFIEFDLTSIAGATVSAVALKCADINSGGGWTTGAEARARLKDYGSSVTTGDYVSGASISGSTLLAHIASTAFTDGALKTWTNDSGMVTAVQAAVGSTIRMILSTDRQEAVTTPPNFEYMETQTTAGTSSTNWQIDVTYTEAASDSPDPMGSMGFFG